jgi:lantibiotic modifying enzyme
MDRERLLDLLWAGVEENAHLLPLISAERRDLMEADIPIFTTRPATNDIFTSTGKRIGDFLEKTGLSLSRKTVESLGPEDLQRQIWFIRASIATLDLQKDELTRKYYKPVWPSSIVGRKQLAAQLIEEARRVGTRLQELALHEEHNATWIGFAYVNKVWSLDPLFEDLYGGSSGIILALAYLGSFGFSEFTELARRALNTLRTRLENKRNSSHTAAACLTACLDCWIRTRAWISSGAAPAVLAHYWLSSGFLARTKLRPWLLNAVICCFRKCGPWNMEQPGSTTLKP